MPRRVLMLARHFPPIGGAGVQRSLGYVRHLPEHGFRPVVVTGAEGTSDRFSPTDRALLERVPGGTEIHRVARPEPRARGRWGRRADRWLGRSEPWVRNWVEQAVRAGSEVGRDCELILASCVPYETAEAGATLAATLGKPWVADLEDPWALDEMRVHPTALHQRRDLARMRRALASASAIVMSAPEAAARVKRALPEHARGLVAGVPIGYDPEEFRSVPHATTDDGVLRIVHTGSMHTELGLEHRRSARLRRLLGGNSVDVDILTRSPAFLIQAITRLEQVEPALMGRVELHLAGALTAGDRALVEGHPFVHLHGQLPHAQTVSLMRSAGLLFLPMHELPPGERAGLIPYKTFEYLAARRPILAAVPDGDVRDMLAPIARVTLCRPSDVAAIALAIRDRLRGGRSSAEAPGQGCPELPDLARDRLTGRLAAVLDAAIERSERNRDVPLAGAAPLTVRARPG